jgi:predicted nuclease with TOPRIM domain
MRHIIKKVLKEEVEKKGKDICNILTVDTYEEGIKLLEGYMGTMKENPEKWDSIKKPLKMWKEASDEIKKEIDEDGMSGDSEVDESDTWWSAIQTTLCK